MNSLAALAPGGDEAPLWQRGRSWKKLAPPVWNARWWLENQDLVTEDTSVDLVLQTPARLISRGRPLFRADFRSFFPFVLRRVTSMTFAHCQVELLEETSVLFQALAGIQGSESRLTWKDWRPLGRAGELLGGVSGSLRLQGGGLQDVLWVLALGSLLNVGKGAAFGAGHYLLRPVG